MAEDTPPRKSGRSRKTSRKYTDDLFETLDLEISDDDSLIPIRIRDEEADNDEDFDVEQVISEPELSVEDESSAVEASEGSGIVTPEELEGNESSDGQLPEYTESRRKKYPWKPITNTHFRGVVDTKFDVSHGSQRLFLERIVGTEEGDVTSHRSAVLKWANEVSLPTKDSRGSDAGGMCHPFNHTPKQREMEATVGWDWYYLEGGKQCFTKKQKIRTLSSGDITKYVPRPTQDGVTVLMGPYGRQRLFSISFMHSLNIDQAWSQAPAINPVKSGFTPVQKTPTKRQDGWVLNVGASVQCLDWAPNHRDIQYLAVSTIPTNENSYRGESSTAPAYTSLPGPSSIQIWATGKREDEFLPPQLRLIMCTEWGHAKQLKWCPMPRAARDGAGESRISLGLLAGVWADGYVRVLDLYVLENREMSSTRYIKFEEPAFESKPADALCTCVDWLSPTDIAVGFSNGYLAIWDIFPVKAQEPHSEQSPHQEDPTRPESDTSDAHHSDTSIWNEKPAPCLYTFVHTTYILAVCSAYPTHPHLIATSAVSGYLRLTDIRSPHSDYVLSQRTHWAPTALSYCPTFSCFVSHEEMGYVKLYPIRRFWGAIGCAKGDSEILSVAVGHYHPTALAGFADGTLLAVNLARRFVEVRATRSMLQHRVWKHEWARQKPNIDGQKSSDAGVEPSLRRQVEHISKEPTAEVSQGQAGQSIEKPNDQDSPRQPKAISRITEGYKVEAPILVPRSEVDSKNTKKAQTLVLAPFSTIHDKETGVRHVAWNPNEDWGGWAASGTGSGLIRIEDLAI